MINEEGIKKIIFVFKNSSKELKNTIENKQDKEKELWNVLNIIKNNFDEIKKMKITKSY